MAKEADHLAGTIGSDKADSVLSRLLADENEFDRRALWRLGSWGTAAVGAVIVATLANQSSIGLRREQTAAADLARQARELQSLTRESQGETRRLTSAVDTLNGDRDRLYSRVTVLEQGLESVTGALARQNTAATAPAAPQATAPKTTAGSASASAPAEPPAAPAPPTQAAAAPPTVAPVATIAPALTERPKHEPPPPKPAQASVVVPPQQEQVSEPAAPASLPKIASTAPAPSAPAVASSSLLPPTSLMGPPDPAASKLEPAKDLAKLPAGAAPAASPETAAAQPSANDNEAAPDSAAAKVERTEFAVDVGSANSVGGLRALWRGLVKSNADLAALKPIIVVKERSNGLGMQLRLAAGPLMDAAAAAKICAALSESERACETTLFDGQRLALGNDDSADKSAATPPTPKLLPATRGRHSVQKGQRHDDPPPPKPEPSALSSFFGRK
jgi:hypothetical protein